MAHFITLVVMLLSGIVFSILAMPIPDGFDDEGEMSVPRSPKIQGPATVNLPYTNFKEVTSLECLIEGSPTPTVFWSKDGKEIRDGSDLYNLYNMTYNASDGKAELHFLESARQERKYMTGNFTCMAANFLGRAQKIFAIEVTEKQVSTTNNATTQNPLSVDTTSSGSDQPSIMTEISTSVNYSMPHSSTLKTRTTSTFASSTSIGTEPGTAEASSTREPSSTITSRNGTDLDKH